VTPPVPSWRTDDDAVTALQWLRKYLRHAPSGGGDAYSRRGEHAGAATHKLFRDRRVRRGSGSFEAYEPVRHLKRAAKSRVLEPGEFLAVPDDRHTKGWYWATFRDESEDEDAAADAASNAAFAEAIQKCVIYKDDHVLAINKPPGLSTTPGQGIDVSVHDLRWALKFDAAESPRLVHRLDRDTSGVLVLARTAFAANKLNALFRKKSKTDFTEILRAQLSSGDSSVPEDGLTKTYWALAGTRPPRGLCEGWVDAPLLEGSDNSEDDSSRELVRLVGGWRVYDATASDGSVIVGAGETSRANFREEAQIGSKAATTKFKVLASADEHGPTLLELTPVTGRKHQLRVHVSKALASPLLGDYKYGWSDKNKIWKSKLIAIEDAARQRHDDADVQEPHESILGRAMRRTSNARGIPLHLHARSLRFSHPDTGEATTLVASPPEHFVAAMREFDLRIGDNDDA
jgi:23S rRNA-/tRNA-specific pseudouridylate synthase